MSIRPIRGALAVIPPLAAALSGGAAFALQPPGSGFLQASLWIACIAASAVSVIEIAALAYFASRAGGDSDGWRRETEDLSGLVRSRDTEIARLRGEVEILTAIREIGLIVNADDDFEDVLTKVLDMVGESMKADELVLFLVDASTKSLEPVARRLDRCVSFRKGMKNPPLSMTNVAEALAHGRMLEAQEWNGYSFALPLVVDREVVGVIKAVLHDPAAALKDSSRAEEARRFFRGTERHLALAIKTPSLYNRAVLDGLTGLFTRRHLDNQLEGFFHIARRRKTPLAFILSDIDHFKKINDNHGHQSGDVVLKGVSKILRKEIRRYDSAYRYGGEELCVLLPDTGIEGARMIAERIREKVQAAAFKGEKREPIPVTISLGVSEYAPWMKGPSDMVSSADKSLYKAKEGGRNRVVCSAGGAPAVTEAASEPPSPQKSRRKPRRKKNPGVKPGGDRAAT